MVPQRFRDEIGVVTGIVGAAGGLGGFVLPSVLGIMKDLTGSYGTGFLAFSLVALGCLTPIGLHRHQWRLSWSPKGVIGQPVRRELLPEVAATQSRRVRMEVVFGE